MTDIVYTDQDSLAVDLFLKVIKECNLKPSDVERDVHGVFCTRGDGIQFYFYKSSRWFSVKYMAEYEEKGENVASFELSEDSYIGLLGHWVWLRQKLAEKKLSKEDQEKADLLKALKEKVKDV